MSGSAKRSKRVRLAPGDVVAVPFTRDLGAALVVRDLGRGTAVFEVLASMWRRGSEWQDDADGERSLGRINAWVDTTCLKFDWWRKIGSTALPATEYRRKVVNMSPSFPAALEALDLHREAGHLAEDFRVYFQVLCCAAKWHQLQRERAQTTMAFLRRHELLSPAGLDETVDEEFVLHSDLLTDTGRRFYDEVFRCAYVPDEFASDTEAKLEHWWWEFERAGTAERLYSARHYQGLFEAEWPPASAQ